MSGRVRVFLALLLVLLTTPRWMGEERLDRHAGPVALTAERVALDPERPGLRRAGRLRYLGGVVLASGERTFGGYSALAVDGERYTLLSDRGQVLRFRMGHDWKPRDARTVPLTAGPATGWYEWDRDAESLVLDERAGRAWVAFERYNQVWRYAGDFARAERGRAPRAMARWPDAGGPEAMARLADGRFVVLGEQARPPKSPRWKKGERRLARDGLIFAGDPTAPGTAPARFAYRPARGHDPVDVTELPDGRVLVLERGFDLPFRWTTRLAVVERRAIRPGAVVTGRTLARLAAPLVSDNFEGLAVAREGDATVLWLVSDDNQMRLLQRTLLLKFRLE